MRTIKLLQRASLATSVWLYTIAASAAVYGGGGLSEGATEAQQIAGNIGLREKIIEILKTVLSFLGLIALVIVVIAGIRLVISQGEEEQKEKAKRMILYTLAGLIVILIARGLVMLVADSVTP